MPPGPRAAFIPRHGVRRWRLYAAVQQTGVCEGIALKRLHAYVTGTIERALSAAGLHAGRRRAGNGPAQGGPSAAAPLQVDVAATIERALSAAGLAPAAGSVQAFGAALAPVTLPVTPPASSPGLLGAARPQPAQRPAAAPRTTGIADPAPRDDRTPARGISLRRSFGNASGNRDYTLYVPPARDPDAPRPLLLMLHGCTQDPDDFARGTAMNALADAHGLLVAYPEQTGRDNGSRCWTAARTSSATRAKPRSWPASCATWLRSIASILRACTWPACRRVRRWR